jgi:hypothetical protein
MIAARLSAIMCFKTGMSYLVQRISGFNASNFTDVFLKTCPHSAPKMP